VYADPAYQETVASLTTQLLALREQYQDSDSLDQVNIDRYDDINRWWE